MIKELLRYKLIEICLNTIFEKIGSNFKQHTQISIGDHFSRIVVDDSSRYGEELKREYVNCTITAVYHGELFNKAVSIYDFIDSSGCVIMSCSQWDTKFYT